jgi:chorismate-pyruvate lyase
MPAESSNLFDPFMDLMLMQATRPAHLAPVDLRKLSPFQRALLAIDGTVTKFIEAYTLEPIEVVKLLQQPQMLNQAHPLLQTPAETPLIARQVLLQGRYSSTIYAYAASLLLPQRLPLDLMKHLEVAPAGLGRILLDSHLENRREILWYGIEDKANWLNTLPISLIHLGETWLSRTYRILVQQQPVMLINEKFPLSELKS